MKAQGERPVDSGVKVSWADDGSEYSACWRCEAGFPPPQRLVTAVDTLGADAAYRLACEGTSLLWLGDFQNARQLLQAMARRFERKPRRPVAVPDSPREAFHRHRMVQSRRARILGRLLIPVLAGHRIALRRAPDVRDACEAAYGPADAPYVLSLRELLGVIGAYEWRRKGVFVAALQDRIYPHYGVFSPVRGEYVALVAEAPLPPALVGREGMAFDVGTGTGVLAAVLARRGIAHVVGTDRDARALACAGDNIRRLGLEKQVTVACADLFPTGGAALAVCNPPWLPARPGTALDQAVYDPESAMLRGFLEGLAAHLEPGGEGWLILSDLAEHLELRTREELLSWFEAAGLVILERRDVRPTHGRVFDAGDPLHAARAAEVTSLWRLAVRT